MPNELAFKSPGLQKMRARFYAGLAAMLAMAACTLPVHAADPSPEALKANFATKEAFSAAARTAAQSTVRILVSMEEPNKPDRAVPAAYGTIMTADGFILTKSSEVINHKKIFVKLAGAEVEAKVVGVRESYDLAMLKVDAKNLKPVVLADTAPPPMPAKAPTSQPLMPRGPRGFGRMLAQPTGPIPAVAPPAPAPADRVPVTVGEFVITPEAAASEKPEDREKLAPKNYGVISVTRRAIPFSSGVLGVSLDDYVPDNAPQPQGALVTEVFMQSGAGRAGVKPNDVITAVDGAPVSSRLALQNIIRRHYPTDIVTLSITRGNDSLSLRVQLGDSILATPEDVEMAVLSGSINTRSSDFQAVFQHDTVLAPSDMGGPLVDLDGRVIGINIARAGRTETYAIPADLLTDRWLATMKDGTFAPHAKP